MWFHVGSKKPVSERDDDKEVEGGKRERGGRSKSHPAHSQSHVCCLSIAKKCGVVLPRGCQCLCVRATLQLASTPRFGLQWNSWGSRRNKAKLRKATWALLTPPFH